jgi:hypothetical protein
MITVDKRRSKEECIGMLQKGKEIAEKVANANSLTYLDNKTVDDLYEEMLAKRVIRAFKNNVCQKVRSKVFKVLYRCTELDIHASICLAQEIKV